MSKFPGRMWRQAKVENLVRKITDLPVEIKFVSFKSLKNFVAVAHATDPADPLDTGVPRIEFAARKFREALIWHESTHLLFPDWYTKDPVKKEARCHINAVKLALDRGRPDMANKLLEATEQWPKYPHNKAGPIVRRYFGWTTKKR